MRWLLAGAAWLLVGGVAVARQLSGGSGDFREFWDNARVLVWGIEGARLHATGASYPPLFHLLLAPLALLPLGVAAAAWYALCSAAGAWALSRPPRAAGLLCLPLAVYDLVIGNANLLVLALLLAMARSLDREARAGTALGLAVGLKLLAFPLVPWLAWRGRWRAAGVAAAVAGASLFSLGTERAAHWFGEMSRQGAWFRREDALRAANESLGSTLARLTTPVDARAVGGPTGAVNLVALPPEWAAGIAEGARWVVIVGVIAACGRLGRVGPRREAWEIAWVLAGVLLAAPVVWVNYKLLLWFTWAVAVTTPGSRVLWMLGAAGILAGVVPGAAAYGVPALAMIVLGAGLFRSRLNRPPT